MCCSIGGRWGEEQWWNIIQLLHRTCLGWLWKRLHLWWGMGPVETHKYTPNKEWTINGQPIRHEEDAEPGPCWTCITIELIICAHMLTEYKSFNHPDLNNVSINYSRSNFASSSSQLLNRVFNIMREKNPDMVAGEKRKFVMKPPQVVRVGTKKTSFVNFTDICKLWASHSASSYTLISLLSSNPFDLLMI